MKTNLNFNHTKHNLMIRTLEYLKERELDGLFRNIDPSMEFPLYYQYCQKERVVEPKQNDHIGFVTKHSV